MNKYNTEVWKDVKDYEGLYQVSNQGRVKTLEKTIYYRGQNRTSVSKEKVLKTRVNRWGYESVNLTKEYKMKTFQVHTLVARAYLGDKVKRYVNHIDGYKLNNVPANLEYVEAKENVKHAFETGLRVRGDNARRLNKELVLEIRKRYIKDVKFTQKDLAEEYGFSVRCISDVVNSKTWKEVPSCEELERAI